MAAEVGGGDSGHGKKQKKGRAKKPNPRIDMTPMVDLGFLLLTFFVLTTTMSTPKSMPIALPEKLDTGDKSPPIAESKVLILLLGKDHKVFYYQGVAKDENVDLKETNFSKTGLRKVLAQYRQSVEAKWGKDEMIVLIKASDDSKYKDVVDSFDEMNITNQRKYAMVEITPEEKELLSGDSGTDGAGASSSKKKNK